MLFRSEWDKATSVSMVAEDGGSYGGEPLSAKQNKQNQMADMAIEITNIVERHCRVDWANSDRILDKIAQDIDDMFYLYECSGKCKFSLDVIDKVIESVKTTALRRFRS